MSETIAIGSAGAEPASALLPALELAGAAEEQMKCFHCGTLCRAAVLSKNEQAFCCQGCLTVFEILTENGLGDFYKLGQSAGVRVKSAIKEGLFAYLDEPAVRERLVDFADERITRVTFRLPAIHCIACVWLLENLFRLKPGIGQSQVNFPRREASITFESSKVKLSEIAALLASLGYEPEMKFSDLEIRAKNPAIRRLWLQLGVAGFAFGNTMLFSIAHYLGLDSFSGPTFQKLVGVISLLLALPVVAYSASDYWRSAWISLRGRLLNIDVPIAAGIAALFAQSTYEVVTGRGAGYFDSLAGLLFFLLCGKLFQQKTFDRLAFDRDYKSFFPLSVTRRILLTRPSAFAKATADTADKSATLSPAEGYPFSEGGAGDPPAPPGDPPGGMAVMFRCEKTVPLRSMPLPVSSGGSPVLPALNTDTAGEGRVRGTLAATESREERVSLVQLQVGDHLVIRNGELIAADARLVEGPAVIDYSFVTGESEPVEKKAGDYLYAGGRQIGGAIEVEMTKPVSQGYLTSLWNQDAFRKEKGGSLNALTNHYSRRFTKIVIGIAVGAAAFWAFVNPALSLKAFTSVLIVACPCALALAAPFALGTAQRVLARRNVFLKNPYVLETLARVDAVVFDKTGTLTAAGGGSVVFHGAALKEAEERWLYSMTRHSTHPYAARIGEVSARDRFPEPVRSFLETAGCGMEGSVAGNEIWMGSAAWLESRGVRSAAHGATPQGSVVHVAINGHYRGCYVLGSALRREMDQLISKLSANRELALLSGDNEKERERFAALFGRSARLLFNQSPLDKLGFIQRLQQGGQTVMMVGDGLNDAGALKQSDVGVAVVEDISAFSPASDAIMAAGMVPCLHEVLSFSKAAVRIVRLSFLISTVYNVVGVSIAARGLLSPVVCAILMPLSSVTVVGFACGLTTWLGRSAFPPHPALSPDGGEGARLVRRSFGEGGRAGEGEDSVHASDGSEAISGQNFAAEVKP